MKVFTWSLHDLFVDLLCGHVFLSFSLFLSLLHTLILRAGIKCLFGTGVVNEFSSCQHLSVIKASCVVITAATLALTSPTCHTLYSSLFKT